MNEKITTIIIDDEKLARNITRGYLAKHLNIEIVAECANGFDAIKKNQRAKTGYCFSGYPDAEN